MYSGCRRSEALALRWDDIDYPQQLITIRGTKTESSNRKIYLTEDLRDILSLQWLATSKHTDYVFPYSAQQVTRTFKKLCPAHHLHDLRHTYITRCAESGMNITVCQQLVGHSSPDMILKIYTHVFDEFKKKEAAKFRLDPLDTEKGR